MRAVWDRADLNAMNCRQLTFRPAEAERLRQEIIRRGTVLAAVLNSLIATCKRQRIDPFAYLRDVLQRIAAHPRHRLEELLSDEWAVAQEPVTP